MSPTSYRAAPPRDTHSVSRCEKIYVSARPLTVKKICKILLGGRFHISLSLPHIRCWRRFAPFIFAKKIFCFRLFASAFDFYSRLGHAVSQSTVAQYADIYSTPNLVGSKYMAYELFYRNLPYLRRLRHARRAARYHNLRNL